MALMATWILSVTDPARAQTDSSQNCPLRISLLTCTPGSELYSTFGHSAFRVQDSRDGSDRIFNFGTFDFNDPNFYQKFIRGKLLYFLSIDAFEDFTHQYRMERRGITEQVLNLDCRQQTRLLAALTENAMEENRYYKYDFQYDNCTTRLRDLLERLLGDSLSIPALLPNRTRSFRNLIHEYLTRGGQDWSRFGIDLLLGSPLDRKVDDRSAQFLPDYLLLALDSSRNGTQPLVSSKTVILERTGSDQTAGLLTPFRVFLLLFLIIALLSFLPAAQRFLSFFDPVFFMLTGLLGWLLLFMWFFTDHQACRWNLNLAWAFPLHLIAGIRMRKYPLNNYFFVTIILLLLVFIASLFLQQLNPAFYPIAGILLLRSIQRIRPIHRRGSPKGPAAAP